MIPTVNIIGPGRVGRTLGRLLRGAQLAAIQDVLSTNPASAESAVTFLGGGHAAPALRDMRPAHIWLLTSPDQAMGPLAAALAATGIVRPTDVAMHCSGALASTVLAPLAAAGASVASIHPLKSFADPIDAAATFSGTFCSTEGDAAALRVLAPLFEALGARLLPIDSSRKTLYHAASVLVCNDLTALLEAGLQAYRHAGIDRATAQEIMEPLVRETVDNVFRLGTGRALTGPVARGDATVVTEQLTALLSIDPEVAAAYRALGVIALDLARRTRSTQGGATEEALAAVAEALEITGAPPVRP